MNILKKKLWYQCKKCCEVTFYYDFSYHFWICSNCEYYHKINPLKRFNIIYNNSNFKRLMLPNTSIDPLKYQDKKEYITKLRNNKKQFNHQDALYLSEGMVDKNLITIAIFNFEFLGGSMGLSVGEGIIYAVKNAIKKQTPLIIVTSSGGARMQEGILSTKANLV